MPDPDIIIIGAGVAGLAAAAELARAGLYAIILEARDRMGGRVFTTRERDIPIELGAEFIHGKPPEIWQLLQHSGAEVLEVHGQSWCSEDSQLHPCIFFSQVESILSEMNDSLPDESFLAFLNRRFPSLKHDPDLENARQHALRYVIGFNAADPSLVGVHWLVEEMRAEERIEGHRAFRSGNGYEDLIAILRRQISLHGVTVHYETVARKLGWSQGQVEISALQADGSAVFKSPRALITLPLALLKAPPGEIGAVEFVPPLPQSKLGSLGKLEVGKIIRIVLRFRHRFWDNISPAPRQSLSDMAFLFSEDDLFPTWWTSMPRKFPIITGWAPFRAAEQLSGKPDDEVVARSLQSLSKVLKADRRQIEGWLESAHFHNWQTDPFSRGAYSYGKAGCDGAQEALAAPVENTLFFAGEATDTTGQNGTVHGAIASAYRAAREILERLR
jgi:monoamine oxidase